jgi:hypothetical protein
VQLAGDLAQGDRAAAAHSPVRLQPEHVEHVAVFVGSLADRLPARVGAAENLHLATAIVVNHSTRHWPGISRSLETLARSSSLIASSSSARPALPVPAAYIKMLR